MLYHELTLGPGLHAARVAELDTHLHGPRFVARRMLRSVSR